MKKLLVILFTISLLACSSIDKQEEPEQFEPGKPVVPPKGCIELRARGGEC